MSFISYNSASSVHAPLTDDAPPNLSTNARHNRYVVISTEYDFKQTELKDRTALANYQDKIIYISGGILSRQNAYQFPELNLNSSRISFTTSTNPSSEPSKEIWAFNVDTKTLKEAGEL